MDKSLSTPPIQSIPADIMRILGVYIGDVARAASCSVSTWWYERILAVSKYLSNAPELYIAHTHTNMTDTAAVAILADYHLTVRYNKHRLHTMTKQMCLAGNRSVCELFMRFGFTTSKYAIVARDPWFHTYMTDISSLTVDEQVDLIVFMLTRGHTDTLIEYFHGDKYKQIKWNKITGTDRSMLVNAVIGSNDPRVVTWIDNAPNYWLCMCNEIIARDCVDLVLGLYNEGTSDRLLNSVCVYGSIAMLEKIRPCYQDISLEQMLDYAFFGDNLIVFDYLISIGATTADISFIDGVIEGSIQCCTRIKPATVDIRNLITVIVENQNFPLSFAIENFTLSTADFNYGLRICVRDGYSPTEFIPHADNYDVAVYKKYGMVILTDDHQSIL